MIGMLDCNSIEEYNEAIREIDRKALEEFQKFENSMKEKSKWNCEEQ